jgi:RNA polymerase sigma factor (sigma-70 family)
MSSARSSPLALSEIALHERYARRIDRIVASVVGRDSEREDLVHETLIRVFMGIGRVRDAACLDHWVAQVTLNTVRGALRRRKRDRWTSLDAMPLKDEPARIFDVERHELASRTIRLIDRLPPRDRQLLERHWFTDHTMAEIGMNLGCSAVTVKRKLRRARERFHRLALSDHVLAPNVTELRASTATPADAPEAVALAG